MMTLIMLAYLAIPLPRVAERCVEPGVRPAAGQTIHADKTCKSGLRWKTQK